MVPRPKNMNSLWTISISVYILFYTWNNQVNFILYFNFFDSYQQKSYTKCFHNKIYDTFLILSQHPLV